MLTFMRRERKYTVNFKLGTYANVGHPQGNFKFIDSEVVFLSSNRCCSLITMSMCMQY